MFKKLIIACLSLWLGAAQAGFTDPLTLTEIPGNRLIEPGAHSIVTYHVTSNVTNQVVPFTIVPNRYFSVRHQGFTCGSINNPNVAAGGSCQFQLEMHQAPFTPGTFTATQRIKTQGADRGGSNGALIRKTITYTIDTPNALSFSPEPIQDIEVEDNGDGDREIFLFYTIHNGGTGTISDIEWDITPDDGSATGSTFAEVANTCSNQALPTTDGVEGTLDFNLAAGASCSIVYRFSADSTAGIATLDLQATAAGGFDTGAKQTRIHVVPNPITWSRTETLTGQSNQGVGIYTSSAANTAYLLSSRNIRKTIDDGATWTVRYNGSDEGTELVSLTGLDDDVYASGATLTPDEFCGFFGCFTYFVSENPLIVKQTDGAANTWTDIYTAFNTAEGFSQGYLSHLAVVSPDAANADDELTAAYNNVFDFFGEIFFTDAVEDFLQLAVNNDGIIAEVQGFARSSATTLYAALTDRVLVTTNGGATWDETITSPGLAHGERITSIVVDDNDIFLGTTTSIRQGRSGIWRSLDGGATWERVNSDIAEANTNVFANVHHVLSLSITEDDSNVFHLYIGSTHGVFRCDNVATEVDDTINCYHSNGFLSSIINPDDPFDNFFEDFAIDSTDRVVAISAIHDQGAGATDIDTVYAITSPAGNNSTLKIYRGTIDYA